MFDNYTKLGSTLLNLILLTAGKIKIQIGNKMIDLLDNNENVTSLRILDMEKRIKILENQIKQLENK